MGLFDGLFSKGELTDTELETKSYEKIIQDVKNNLKLDDSQKDSIIDYINNNILIDGKFNELSFKSDDFTLFLNIYENQKDFGTFGLYMGFVNDLYEKVVIDNNDRTQRQFFFKILRYAISKNCELIREIVSDFGCVLNLFERKELFLSFLENIPFNMEHDFRIKYLDYIVKARRFYIDETQFLVRIVTVAKTYLNTSFSKNKIDSLFLEDRRNAGLYDVSLQDIEVIEDSMSSLKKEVSKFIGDIRIDLARISKDVSTLEGSYAKEVEKKFTKLNEELQKYSLEIDKDKIDVLGYFNSLKGVMEELKVELDQVSANLVRGEAIRLTTDYEDCVSLINRMISSSNNMGNDYKEVVKQVGEILKRLVSSLSDNKDKTLVKEDGQEHEEENFVDTGKNKYLDSSRSLKERLAMALANKKPGEIYHASVDKVIKEILNNNTVYLVGPSGSCKTYSIKQVAEILELPLYNFGFVTDEHETFKSYKDVNGNFVKNIFYHAYKNGGICFFDEIDNSESKALVELNRIIGGNGEYEAYLFPNGELVYPHPNLRIVTAGNTYGDGASEAYSTRERLDFGTVDRSQAIEYYYDRVLEKRVLEDYPDAFDFCMAYREALESIGYEYSLTTRKIFKIKKNLDSGCYTPEEIVNDFFVSGLRIDVLENIKNNISIRNNAYYNAFVSIVDSRKKTYTRRRSR